MELAKRLDKAINYIEDHLTEELNAQNVAREVYLSSTHLQRLFLSITDMTLGEYIRRRRLTLAGQSIRCSKRKIIDIAYQYGYQTPESFSRAFKRFHGASPMMVRNLAGTLNTQNRITMQTILKGVENMVELKQTAYHVVENRPVYHTMDMERTALWFENVLGWYAGIDGRDADNKPIYGCAMPFPSELVHMKIAEFNGVHFFSGTPSQNTVMFIYIDDVQALRNYVIKNGWKDITEISEQPWGAKVCHVTTVDGSRLTFFELV